MTRSAQIYLVDDIASQLHEDLIRAIPAVADRLRISVPERLDNAVLVGSLLPFDAESLGVAKGILLVAPTISERDRVQVALAGREKVCVAVASDPRPDLQAERMLTLFLALSDHMPAIHQPVLQAGSTVGLLGFRGAGWSLARLLATQDLEVIFWSPEVNPRQMEEERKHALRTGAARVEFSALLRQSDVLLVDMPDQPKLPPWIGREELAALRDGARIINTTSGTAIDDGALIQALRGVYLGGVALDRTNLEPLPSDSPLRTFDRVLLGGRWDTINLDLARRILASRTARELANCPQLNLDLRRVRHVVRRKTRRSVSGDQEAKG